MGPGVVSMDARLAVKHKASRGINEGADYISNSNKCNIIMRAAGLWLDAEAKQGGDADSIGNFAVDNQLNGILQGQFH